MIAFFFKFSFWLCLCNSPSGSGAQGQADLKLTGIHLPLLSAGVKGVCLHPLEFEALNFRVMGSRPTVSRVDNLNLHLQNFNPCPQEPKEANLCELEASLVCIEFQVSQCYNKEKIQRRQGLAQYYTVTDVVQIVPGLNETLD